MTRRVLVVLFALALTPVFTGEGAQRPDHWARPLASEHLKNFYQLDDKVYRSDQPGRKGFEELRQRGIRSILNLRDHHSDERKAKGLGLNLYRVEMSAGDIRTDDVIAALRIIRFAEGPVLIHCWHGSDRTGVVSAMYRIVFQNWSREQAIDELKNGGYGYHSIYDNIPRFIESATIEEIRQKVFAAAP